MEGKIVDCDWGKNGEDEPALWDDWMMGDSENDLQEVPVGLFEDWDPENAMNAVAGGNQNDSQEVPVELFDDWDLEDEMRAGIHTVPKDDDKSVGGAVLADQHKMSGEEKNSPEVGVVGLPRMNEVMSTVS